jgi:prepilin signal peptidase PulO-like enzyme (type II secretory pathway)
MKLILTIPMQTRLAVVFVLGVCLGAAVNWAIYRFAWNRRSISPWSLPDPSAPPRRLCDRLPIVGWLGLRREAGMHGAGFWIRPMLLETLLSVGLAWLYWWEVCQKGLLPFHLPVPNAPFWQPLLHAAFASHAILIALMLAASMIDVDEKTIPDEITVVGTLVGLVLAVAAPRSLLPDNLPRLALGTPWNCLNLTSPNDWPNVLDGAPNVVPLLVALGCWWAWCVAILPRSWYSRHGWRRAVQLCCARMGRMRSTHRILWMGAIGSLAIGLVWRHGGDNWQALLSSLVGMAASGGLVWAVRVIGAAVLHREAMGFGDVTLMAMIGAFLGWQPCLIIFFLAPFAGLVIGVLRLILFRDREIPYGPFLCLAALVVIVGWAYLWLRTAPTFALGWIVPLAVLCCLGLMAVMLGTWRLIVSAFR